MKFGFYFFLLIFNVLNPQSGTSIDPYYGVGDLKLSKTTINDVKERYPKAVVSKYWNSSPFPGVGNFVKKMSINDNLILTFEKKKRCGKYYLSSIFLMNDFDERTLRGVGKGSSYRDIVSEFGNNAGIRINESSSSVNYSKGIVGRSNNMASIIFYCENRHADSTNFVVDKILIN